MTFLEEGVFCARRFPVMGKMKSNNSNNFPGNKAVIFIWSACLKFRNPIVGLFMFRHAMHLTKMPTAFLTTKKVALYLPWEHSHFSGTFPLSADFLSFVLLKRTY